MTSARMTTLGKPRGQLTQRDQQLVAWAVRFRWITHHQAGARMGTSFATVVDRRLRVLRERGYVSTARWLWDEPVAISVTAAGSRWVGSRLPAGGVDERCWHHDKALPWVALMLEGEGWSVTTEREIEAIRRRGGWRQRPRPSEQVCVRLEGASGVRLHAPDLIAERGAERLAWEVELHPKEGRRLEQILRGYRRTEHFTGVVYAVGNAALAQLVAATTARLSMVDMVSIRAMADVPQPLVRRGGTRAAGARAGGDGGPVAMLGRSPAIRAARSGRER